MADYGIGLPRGFNIRKTTSLGLQTVCTLIKQQLKGRIVFESNNGTTCTISLKTDIFETRVKKTIQYIPLS